MPFRTIPWKGNQLRTKRSSRIDDFWCTDKSFCEVILLLFRKLFQVWGCISLRLYTAPPPLTLYKYQGRFCFVIFFRGIPFHSVPFRASELALPRNSECLGMSAFFRGITETVPSLFRGIFSERNSVPNPKSDGCLSLGFVSIGTVLARHWYQALLITASDQPSWTYCNLVFFLAILVQPF
jgi:hypothetical protein